MPVRLPRRTTHYLSVAVIALLTGPGWAAAQPHRVACTPAQAQAADPALAKVGSWSDLHTYYRRYAACENDDTSEGVVEAVVHTLAHHWSWLPKLSAEIKADPAFGKFVVDHIDSTADYGDLGEIKRTATSLCPSTLTGLCRRLKQQATAALREPE